MSLFGHIVSKEGSDINLDKTEVIFEVQFSSTNRGVRAF